VLASTPIYALISGAWWRTIALWDLIFDRLDNLSEIQTTPNDQKYEFKLLPI
jgi:hypothetical protein